MRTSMGPELARQGATGKVYRFRTYTGDVWLVIAPTRLKVLLFVCV